MKTKFAELVLLAVKIREDSYDHKAANEAQQEAERKNFKRVTISFYSVDYSQFYKHTLYDSCQKAAVELNESVEMASFVYFGLYNSWNDFIELAQIIVGENK